MRRADAEPEQLPFLATFARAAELCSFTAAARALGLTQAAVSQRIQALEVAVGQPLFHRTGGRVRPTAAGQRLYEYSQRILALHREARQALTGPEPPAAGDLYLAASSIPGEHLLPAVLPDFAAGHPHLRVHVAIGDSLGVIGQVERGEASLGLVGRKADAPHLEFRFLARDRMVAVVPPGHRLARRQAVPLGLLLEHPLVVREAGSGLRHCFARALERAGQAWADCRVALELGSNEAIKAAVAGGVGVAVLSVYAVRKEVQAGHLHALKVTGLRCDRDLFLVQDRRRVLPPPARVFLHFLEAQPLPAVP